VPADDADGPNPGDSEDEPSPSSGGSPLPPWLQPQTVRIVVSGLILVYLVGILVDIRGYESVLLTEIGVLVVIVVLFLLTLRWWEPTGKATTRPRARTFLALAGLALLVQIAGVVAESGYPNDLANNAAPLLLLAILLFNTLG
jgi:hypothetical protein